MLTFDDFRSFCFALDAPTFIASLFVWMSVCLSPVAVQGQFCSGKIMSPVYLKDRNALLSFSLAFIRFFIKNYVGGATVHVHAYPALTLARLSLSLSCPSTWIRARSTVSAASTGRRRRRTETPPRASSWSTRCWERRACSGRGGSAGRAPNPPAEPSASHSRDSTCTDVLSDRSCRSWWRIVWSTWVCPLWDTVGRSEDHNQTGDL